VKDSAVVHDSFLCMLFPSEHIRPWPTKRLTGIFIYLFLNSDILARNYMNIPYTIDTVIYIKNSGAGFTHSILSRIKF
jgi:hypothetical protein